MRTCLLAYGLLLAAIAAAGAAPPIDVELATERGLQITAPQRWLQLVTAAGIDRVRIRAATAADRPQIDNRGSDARPRYHVLGLLSADEQLHLPGGQSFGQGDRHKLRQYFEKLAADGPEALTAPRGRFGLTEKQLSALQAQLAQPLDISTAGQRPAAVVERLSRQQAPPLVPVPRARPALGAAEPFPAELRGLATGTALAILLRHAGLEMRPEKPLGKPVELRIAPPDDQREAWPVGWDPQRVPRQVAPRLMESLHVEIDNYTLRETLDALEPRLKLPLIVDHRTLAEHDIDLDQVIVHIAQTRTFYKHALDRALAQGHLAALLRVDEAGKPFLWITR